MNWDTVYFGVILVALLLTSYLTWYTGRQRGAANRRHLFWLALVGWLLVVCEVATMLSPDSETARFWFNLRFLPLALLPPVWLFFALAHSGRAHWLAHWWISGFFSIPIITQFMVWTNDLHRFWVRQDVGFRESGLLWLWEVAPRVPGAWFSVYVIYIHGLLLAGAFLLVWPAAAAPRRPLVQIGLLGASAGALLFTWLALITGSRWGFSPITPGLILSLLLASLSALRFDPQGRRLAPARVVSPAGAQARRDRSMHLLLLGMLVTILAAVVSISYHKYEASYRAEAGAQLSAVASLKAQDLANWRAERLGNAEVMRRNHVFAGAVGDLLAAPGDPAVRSAVQGRLDVLREAYGYHRVYLVDLHGVELLASPPALGPVNSYLVQALPGILRGGRSAFLDFHRHDDGFVHLGTVAPVYADGDLNRPLAALVFSIDPAARLYPMLTQWPIPSHSSETLLVRRDAGAVLYLSPLRLTGAEPLTLREPLSGPPSAAARAVLGETGVIETLDARGEPIIADLRAVPGSPWFLVTRVDAAEVYAPLRARLWQTLMFFVALVLASGMGFANIWRIQRSRAAEALRESEERFRTLVEQAPAAIFIQAAGRFAYVNNAALALFGAVTPAQLIGRSVVEQFAPAFADQVRRRIRQLNEERVPVPAAEETILRLDGSRVEVDVAAVPFPYRGEHGALVFLQDITVRKRAEAAVRQLNASLEQRVQERTRELQRAQAQLIQQERLALLGQLAGSIAHELRNPLGVISNAAFFLRMVQPEAGSTVHEYFDIIEGEVHASEKIINDLLTLTRNPAPDLQPAAVAAILRRALAHVAIGPAIQVALDLPASLPLLNVDAPQIVQALSNLVTNAVQAMPKGGQLTLGAAPVAGQVRITVQDTGIGIPPENMEHLFEPLFTTRARGIGLGLAVSKKLIEAHAGRIEASSVPGRGATFTVYLPAHQEKP